MAQIEIQSVLIWYAESYRGVEARVRKYAGTVAIEEKSIMLSEGDLSEHAGDRGIDRWDEQDICDLLGDGTVWIKLTNLTSDITE